MNTTPQVIFFLGDASKVVVSLAIKHCFRAKDKRAQFYKAKTWAKSCIIKTKPI